MRVLSFMPVRRRLIALFVLYCSFPLITAAQSSPPENVMVDGKLSEWANPLPNYDKVTKLYYDIHNDKDFLYIALKRPDWAEKVRASGHILFEVSASQQDSSALKIIYPATNIYDVTDMWNYLEVRKADSSTMDRVTIYNDYGIQAGGGFWSYEKDNDKMSKALPPLGMERITTTTVLGADCELAIPLKLLPAIPGSYTIRIILRGESGTAGAAAVLSSFSGMRGAAEDLEHVRDLYVATTLTIHYNLK